MFTGSLESFLNQTDIPTIDKVQVRIEIRDTCFLLVFILKVIRVIILSPLLLFPSFSFPPSLPPLSLSQANLSNIFEYMSVEDADKVFNSLSTSISQGSRLAYWNLFNLRVPSSTPNLKLLTSLSEELYKKDRVFHYTNFFVLEKL